MTSQGSIDFMPPYCGNSSGIGPRFSFSATFPRYSPVLFPVGKLAVTSRHVFWLRLRMSENG